QLERAQPDARTRRHGVREPHLVAAVVQTALAAGDFEYSLSHARHEREREIAVRDRRAARHLTLGALDVHVDPLMIAGGIGELVDDRLVDRHPVGRSQLLADVLQQLGGLLDGQRHAGSRSYIPCTSRPWKRATWLV